MTPPPLEHETKDAPPRLISAVAAIIAVSLLVIWGGTQIWYRHEIGGQARAGEMERQSSFTHGANNPLPILMDRSQARREAEDRLHNYGWINQSAGLARIPIERAMQLVAQEHAGQGAPEKPPSQP